MLQRSCQVLDWKKAGVVFNRSDIRTKRVAVKSLEAEASRKFEEGDDDAFSKGACRKGS